MMLDIIRKKSKIIQAINLAAGFALGQGLYFIANLVLIRSGSYDVVARLGILLGLFSLIQWIGDAGGVSILGKLVTKNRIDRDIFSFCIARICIVFLSVIILWGIYAAFGTTFDLTVWLLVLSSGCLWAINVSGLIDYHGLNGRIAYISSLNWCLPSLLVLFVGDYVRDTWIASAFFLGSILTVGGQWYFLSKSRPISIHFNFNRIGFVFYIRQLLWYTLAYASAQMYGRLVVVFVTGVLSAQVAGTYVFVKNISNAIGQVFIFMRRASHRELLQLVGQVKYSFLDLLRVNRVSLVFVFVLSGLSVILYAITRLYPRESELWVILEFSSAFMIINAVWALNNIFSAVFVSLGNSKGYAAIVSFSSILGMSLAAFFVSTGLYGIFFVELIVYCTVLGLSFGEMNRMRSK